MANMDTWVIQPSNHHMSRLKLLRSGQACSYNARSPKRKIKKQGKKKDK